MRIILAVLGLLTLVAVAGCWSKEKLPPRPELIQVIRPLADQACGCGTDKECLREVRTQFDAVKADLAKHGLTGEDLKTYDAELLRLRLCGDAGGVTMWL
ncbi:MAG: hypothetical protein H0T42_31640 [Deltaproteobacteria bacterium]|nr:hypothetical protein [Deltaproteobacteria bacterium]